MFSKLLLLVMVNLLISSWCAAQKSYAEFWPMAAPESLPQVNCRWEDADRTILVVEGERYLLRVATQPVKILNLSIDGQETLQSGGIDFGIRDSFGDLYSPDPDTKARWNVWRCGPYYWDAHLLDIPFIDESGRTVALGEIVFHIHADRVHIEFLIEPERYFLYTCDALFSFDASDAEMESSVPALTLGTVRILGTQGSKFLSDGSTWLSPMVQNEERVGTYWVLRPASSNLRSEEVFREELNPLSPSQVHIEKGRWAGYNPAAGFYEVTCTTGMVGGGFESWYKNPARRLTSSINLKGDQKRNILIKYSSASAGTVEASLLSDENGWPYPMVVQTCKNFGGEKEEPDDTPFSESYFPVALRPDEELDFNVYHLFQNWGNHPLTQFSSIRFFTIYWHLSTGVTETTCYALNPMTSNAPGSQRFFSIADYRPMSGVMWPGQPQHHHVALQGFLQYLTGDGLQNIVYEKTITKSIAPNLSHFTMFYHTTDDAARCTIDAFELPQVDETRAFVRIRYDFEKPVEIAGDARLNFRILNKGTYIRQIRFPKVSWTDEEGEIETSKIQYDSEPTLLGEMLGGEYPFACLYPHADGNDSVIMRSYSAQLGGKTYSAPAISVNGYQSTREDRAICEMALTVPDEDLVIQPGDFIEAELLLMPYGDEGSSYHTPNLERTRYGIEMPKVEVSIGEKIQDFPTEIRAEDELASFVLNGGFDYIPLTVKGFKSWSSAMLWEGNMWLDQQMHGGDGYQVQPDGEGGYQFTFVYPTRKEQSHGFHVTRADCSTGIKKIYYENGDVVLESENVGDFSLKAPLVFAPGRNTIVKGRPVSSFTGTARSVRSAHLTCAPESKTMVLTTEKFDSDEIQVVVEKGTGRLNFHRLPSRTLYRVMAGEDSWDESSSAGGGLSVSINKPSKIMLNIHSDQTVIPPVVGFSASTQEGIRLQWSPNWAPGVIGYEIQRRADEQWKTLSTIMGQKREYFDTELKLEKTYEYRIRALGHGEQVGPYSEIQSAESPDSIRIYDFIERFEEAQVIKPDGAPRVQISHPLVGNVQKAGIFAHPVPEEDEIVVRYELQLPWGAKTIVGYIGIRDGGEITDGVDFRIRVDGQDVWQTIHDQHSWKEFRVDIGEKTGPVVIDFVTLKGPDNSAYDWAFWGEPGLILH